MGRRKQINCAYCDKENLSKNEIGLNKKLINQNVERMMCITCMATYFETAEEDLKKIIERYKQHGCELFG